MGIKLPAVGPGVETEPEERTELPPAELEYLDYRIAVRNGWDIDDDPFEKAARAGLDERYYGRIEVDRDETLLRSAEAHGLKWASQCRSGTCNACTSVLDGGEAEMDMNLVLTDEQVDDGLRLTCTCYPKSDRLRLLCNAYPLLADEDPGRGREPPADG